ncbi:hypothetical protein [Aliikangiella sp. G2MR2-5]|uniref:hypothetical protein n=1 Tax=Aliikangiella sp. G2MR2-5 TaxID=2788943 RepID=UPI0018AA9479|nr:hypothetical protein [Aliikangiella sp. G2MR2-5]
MVDNTEISYSTSDIVDILKDLNLMVVSFNNIAMASVDNEEVKLAEDILKFMQDKEILDKLASARLTLSAPFEELEDESSINLEEIMSKLPYWSQPKNR